MARRIENEINHHELLARDADLAAKVETFRAVSKTQKAIHLTFVTSRGLVCNSYWNDVQSEVTLDDLFRE